jgi:hypothetical protein
MVHVRRLFFPAGGGRPTVDVHVASTALNGVQFPVQHRTANQAAAAGIYVFHVIEWDRRKVPATPADFNFSVFSYHVA